jgi:hypothetical protein
MIASEERSALCSLRRRTLVGKNRNWYVNPQAGGGDDDRLPLYPGDSCGSDGSQVEDNDACSFRADISKTQLRIWSDNQPFSLNWANWTLFQIGGIVGVTSSFRPHLRTALGHQLRSGPLLALKNNPICQ